MLLGEWRGASARSGLSRMFTHICILSNHNKFMQLKKHERSSMKKRKSLPFRCKIRCFVGSNTDFLSKSSVCQTIDQIAKGFETPHSGQRDLPLGWTYLQNKIAIFDEKILRFIILSSNFLLVCLMLASFLLLQTHAGAMLTSVDLESVSLLTKMDQLVHTSPVRKIVGSCTYLMIEHGFWNLTKISWKNIKIGHSRRDSDVFSWNVFIFDNLHSHSAQSICCRRANFESSHHRANTSSRPSNDFWRKVYEKREIWSQIWCFSQKLIKNLKQYLGVNCFAVG